MTRCSDHFYLLTEARRAALYPRDRRLQRGRIKGHRTALAEFDLTAHPLDDDRRGHGDGDREQCPACAQQFRPRRPE